MDRQAKEKLHLMAAQLKKIKDSQQDVERIEPFKNLQFSLQPDEKQCTLEVFSNNVDDQLKLVCFELNRLYMKRMTYLPIDCL